MNVSAPVTRRTFMGLAAAGAATVAAGCGNSGNGGGSGSNSSAIDWWSIQTNPPIKPIQQSMAKQYQKSHSKVKIKITFLENQAFKSKLTTVMQAGTPPDMFQTWGGGVLKQQIDAGLVKDITADVAPWIDTLTPASVQPYQFDRKTYAIPYDFGMVGFWYNKAHFTKAGVSTIPTTWTELLDTVKQLKSAGLTPIAMGGKDKWPAMYYWAYLAMRVAGIDGLAKAGQNKSFNGADFVHAGELFKELVDLNPFQKGFLGTPQSTPDGQAAAMGNGKTSMTLMGQWAPSSAKTYAAKGSKPVEWGFFSFPTVEGGKGKITDAFGGGDGWAIGKDAPAPTPDYLKFVSDAANQRKMAATGTTLPVVKAATGAVNDPTQKVVLDTLAKATGFQLYLDQAYAPAVGAAVNDSAAALIAGQQTPKQVAQAITAAAKGN